MRNSLSIIIIFFFLPISLFCMQRGDYSAWPDMDFDFHYLSIELDVNTDDRTISGIAEYEVSPKREDIQNLLLFSAETVINQVRISGHDTRFKQLGDSLIIELTETLSAGKRIKVEITYDANPTFGVHFTENGTVWTSMLPKSNRHWLPGFDHPRVEVPSTIHLRVKENQEAVASGYSLGDEVVEDGYKLVGWKSDVKKPLSEIGFVVGNLVYEERLFGSKQIRLYSETDMLNIEVQNDILQKAYQRIRETERFLQVEYPYDGLSLIALEDDRWETRLYAAGIGYLFSNRGELASQIAYPVYAQWFGIYQRPEQWGDAEATLLYQAWLADHFDQSNLAYDEEDYILDEYTSVYKNFSTQRQSGYLGFVQNLDNNTFMDLITSQAREVLISGGHVLGWRGYARFWYQQLGKNLFDKPSFPDHKYEAIPIYDIAIEQKSLSGNYDVNIRPKNNALDDSISLSYTQYDNGESNREEISFAGSGDTFSIDDSDQLDNVIFGNLPGVQLNILKPFEFWLYQLRRDSEPVRRKEAALAIEEFSDHPDLQLALNSVLNSEDNPEVEAAVLRTMAEITKGASGTQSWFLTRLDHEHEAVQLEALRALRYYSDDEIVKREVFEIISLSDNIELVNEGISAYRNLISEEEFVEFTDQFLNEDQERKFTKTLIDELYNTSAIDFANERVDDFLEPVYSFEIRYTTFRHLDWNDYNTERWAERVKTYISDPDPRIRYLMKGRISSLSHEDRERLLIERKSEEYDIRVIEN
ncbi:MAG: hypothetical protein WD267_05515 [Balneolales bacterium]